LLSRNEETQQKKFWTPIASNETEKKYSLNGNPHSRKTQKTENDRNPKTAFIKGRGVAAQRSRDKLLLLLLAVS
jgi:hypothetical protein